MRIGFLSDQNRLELFKVRYIIRNNITIKILNQIKKKFLGREYRGKERGVKKGCLSEVLLVLPSRFRFRVATASPPAVFASTLYSPPS